jgi:hypothetical protein
VITSLFGWRIRAWSSLGRHAIASSAPGKGLRPLGATPLHDGAAMGVVDEDGPEPPAG